MSWTRSFGRFLGYVTAKLGISAVKGKVGDKAGKVVDITKKAGVVLLAVTLMGASCREFGIGFGEGVVAGVGEEFGSRAPKCHEDPPGEICERYPGPIEGDCWVCGGYTDGVWKYIPRPTPSRPPVVTEPTPTFTPSNPPGIPDSSPTPTVTPNPPVPTQTPEPAPTATPPAVTPAPGAGCVPKPGPQPVSLIYKSACPRYMEPLDFEGEGNVNVPGDKKLCAVKSGTGNGRTAWRLGYGLGRQGMRLERFGEVWLQFDAGRGCTDAYGRHFPDCETLYQHPEPDAEYTWGGYSKPAFCEDAPAPTPTAAPTPEKTGDCGCQVVCTVAHLGWNDRPGLPPNVVPGGEARLDITCRNAQFIGDGRGQPVDRGKDPLWCEPESDPVVWDVQTPGAREHYFNDGYGLSLTDLPAGSYRIRVSPRPGALDRLGQPIRLCPWGHNDSVRTELSFEVK